jgi:hypothetical protein
MCEKVEIGDWLVHIPTKETFKVYRVWGEYVLVDNFIDSGDVHPISECRKATNSEIEEEIKKRNCLQGSR